MSRPRVTLYDFVPYGAPELLEYQQPHLTRAVTVASIGLVALFVLAMGATSYLARNAVELPGLDGRSFTLEPPPPIVPPEAFRAFPPAPSVTPPSSSRPVPVPDELANPELTIPSQDDLRQTAPGQARTDGGEGVAPAPAVDDVVPGITDYVYYDEEPHVATRVVPVYPDLAREAGIDGTVQLRVLVGRDGRVKDVHVDRSVLMLDEAAIDAVRRWVFTPALSNGHPVMVWVAVPVKFTLH